MENTQIDHRLTACARAAHEANRAYCIAMGDTSQVGWDEAPAWQRTSALDGVARVLVGDTPEQLHESWVRNKQADGWKHGPVKNADTKEHPCIVPYAQLPPEQRAKDDIFLAVVQAMAVAIPY
jgi:hypothetical protein